MSVIVQLKQFSSNSVLIVLDNRMVALSIVVAIVLVSWYCYYRYLIFWRHIFSFSGPTPLPFIGNAHQFGLNSYDFLHSIFSWWQKYGSGLRVLIGTDANIVITEPKDVEIILSSNTLLDKSKVYDVLHNWLGDGLLTAKRIKWHSYRKMLTPAFHFKILTDFLEVMNSNSSNFIEILSQKADGNIFDIQEITNYFTLDIICDTAMGVNINAMGDSNSEVVKALQYLCFVNQKRIFNPIKRTPFGFRLSSEYSSYQKSLNTMKMFISDVIEKRRIINESKVHKSNDSSDLNIKRKQAFLDTLLTSTIDGRPLKFDEIFDQVSAFMFAGQDTTSSAIAFSAFILSRHPNIQRKAFEEQHVIFGHNPNPKVNSTYENIQQMKYLDIFIKEVMRMYPSVPMIGRNPTTDFNMNGKIIPAHSSLIIFIMAMGYNEKTFPDPYKFDPERFNPEKLKKSNVYEYVPFSAGPRNCIGQKFALLELKSVLSKMIRNFEFLPAIDRLVSKDGYQFWNQSKYDPRLSVVITLKSDNGIQIRLRKRRHQ